MPRKSDRFASLTFGCGADQAPAGMYQGVLGEPKDAALSLAKKNPCAALHLVPIDRF
jgi:hypothetical protein